jgi:plastocyanin domain-containing protein
VTRSLVPVTLALAALSLGLLGANTEAGVGADVQKRTVNVANMRYSPSSVTVERGRPVEITFRGGSNMGCAAAIEFPTLGQRKTVREGRTVTFRFTPSQRGEIPFRCTMDHVRGKVVVR